MLIALSKLPSFVEMHICRQFSFGRTQRAYKVRSENNFVHLSAGFGSDATCLCKVGASDQQ
jgi:hypothetical protein